MISPGDIGRVVQLGSQDNPDGMVVGTLVGYDIREAQFALHVGNDIYFYPCEREQAQERMKEIITFPNLNY